MTKKEINPFREAKKHLWNGEGSYWHSGKLMCICHCITKVYEFTKIGNQARDMVARRLGEHGTVSGWLYTQSKKVGSIIKEKDLKDKNIQPYRHRWLDHLADEWDRGVRK